MTAPEFSVLVGVASRPQDRRIAEILQALEADAGSPSYEVIVALRAGDTFADRPGGEEARLRIVSAARDASLPELRLAALENAHGEYVAVVGDYVVPARGWLAAMARAFRDSPPGTVAAGGVVEHRALASVLDRATFLCEYSRFLPPLVEGPAGPGGVPGMNVGYRRSALTALDRELLRRGFWEHTVHPALAATGGILVSSNAILAVCCRSLPLGHFLVQRWLYSRHFAGSRFTGSRSWLRAPAAVATPLLPVLFLLRQARQAANRSGQAGLLLVALPYLALFDVVAAVGELTGYLKGAGDSLRRIE